MDAETSNYFARMRQMITLLNELVARVEALETRVATAEQSLSQAWSTQ